MDRCAVQAVTVGELASAEHAATTPASVDPLLPTLRPCEQRQRPPQWLHRHPTEPTNTRELRAHRRSEIAVAVCRGVLVGTRHTRVSALDTSALVFWSQTSPVRRT
jgi:hypothetical protein